MTGAKAAIEKWETLDNATREELLATVFCARCGVTTITDYKIDAGKDGIVLKGRCGKCGHKVSRLAENELF
jgi:transcription elongation factor Elf1